MAKMVFCQMLPEIYITQLLNFNMSCSFFATLLRDSNSAFQSYSIIKTKYGSKGIDSLYACLTKEYGRGFSRSNVVGMRQFYMAYREREDEIIQSGMRQLDSVYKKFRL